MMIVAATFFFSFTFVFRSFFVVRFAVWRKVWLRSDVIVNVFFFFSLQIKFKFTSGLLRRKRYHGRFDKSFFVLWRFKSTWIYLPLSHVMTMGNKLMLSYPVSDLSFLVTIQAQHWLKILLDNEFLFVLLRINTF